MSLFNLLQWEIIESPRDNWSYRKVLKKKEETAEEKVKREKTEWKELCKEMKEKLSKEEFNKRRTKTWYERNKEKRIEKQLELYYRNKEEEEAMIEEIYEEVYDPLPDPINYDKYYAEKYKKDDMDSWGKYRYYWWASRLNYIKPSRLPRYDQPIRINKRTNMNVMMSQLWKMQDAAYEYLQPYIDKLDVRDMALSKKQFFTKAPMWASSERMQKILADTDISNNQICTVASALLRNKYMQTELYMGRVGFLVGDIIITQNGNTLRPALENNIPRLNKDTVEWLHKQRMDYLKGKNDDLQIYILWDTYLFKYQINERETFYYIVPT